MKNLDTVPAVEPACDKTSTTPNVFRLVVLFEGGLAVAACLAGWMMEVPPWLRIVWRWDQLAIGLAAALPMVLSLVVIRRARHGPLARLNDVVDQLLVPLFAPCRIWQLAVVSALAGIGEELLFRGVMQPLLSSIIGTVAAIASTSVIFGLLHAVTKTYAMLAFLVSIYLGWLVVAGGGNNLASAIFAHGCYDFFALVYLTRLRGVGKHLFR